jgi:hypothetical protein
MAKNPYSFPARSRADMIAALESIGGYSGWNAPSRRAYPFAWNVKIHRYPSSAKELESFRYGEGEPFNAQWDSAWQRELESDTENSRFNSALEDMRSNLEDYSTYPGDDAGEFSFTFGGRSGGWLILESAYGWQMAGLELSSLADERTQWGVERSEWSFAEVRKLYKAIMTMEADFASAKVDSAYAHAMAFQRMQWEEERRERLAQTIAEVTSDQETAKRLLGELRSLKRLPGLAAYKGACKVLRAAITNAISDARIGRAFALALATGAELPDE